MVDSPSFSGTMSLIMSPIMSPIIALLQNQAVALRTYQGDDGRDLIAERKQAGDLRTEGVFRVDEMFFIVHGGIR